VAYVRFCIAIAAIIVATDQAAKGSVDLLSRCAGLLARPLWIYARLGLIGASALFILGHQLGVVGRQWAA
jgi:hypothetical protein